MEDRNVEILQMKLKISAVYWFVQSIHLDAIMEHAFLGGLDVMVFRTVLMGLTKVQIYAEPISLLVLHHRTGKIMHLNVCRYLLTIQLHQKLFNSWKRCKWEIRVK